MKKVSNSKWTQYQKIIDNYQQGTNQAVVTWFRYTREPDLYKEDWDPKTYEQIPLNALLDYNYRRTWPITQHTDTGELDRQSCEAQFNISYLRTLGYLSGEAKLAYNPDTDFFIIDGLKYKSEGDTPASHAGQNQGLFYCIILKRETNTTGQFDIR